MKYISITSVLEAYKGCKGKTQNKFWGLLAILRVINEPIKPAKSYTFQTSEVSQILDTLFSFNNETKDNRRGDIWSVLFSKKWFQVIPEIMFDETPNIVDVAVWFFRNEAFPDEFNAEKIVSMFLDTFYFSKDEAQYLFDTSIKDVEFSNIPYLNHELLSGICGDEPIPDTNKLSISFETTTFLKSNAGNLGQAAFVQTLYSAQGPQKCLIITQFDFNKEYSKDNQIKSIVNKDQSLQQIYYGAPGTGKSFDIDNICKKHLHYRVTFHPDTDYSSFVGCYKPKNHKKNMLKGNGINETQLLSSFFDSNSPKYNRMNKARYLYEALIHTKDIRDLGLDAQSVADKLNAKGFGGCAYTTEATCMYNIYDWLVADGFVVKNSICYEFVPQAFTKAYLDAWKHQTEGTPVFLVIEEINRGNCAQIFGDLFQLLDRDKDGFSRYEISPDSELQEYINGEGLVIKDIYDSDGNDISDKIARGELMKLPNNLYIWATMNTSDQSLFPIDSAFKRRWDWKYMKIRKGKDENGNELDWKIVVKDKNKNIVKINNEDSLLWWDFIEKINEIIASMTSSADKQLGYFFCCAKDGVIDEETFVSKVIFYLWNDVFKDYGFEDASLFRYTSKDNEGKETEKDLTFPDFYDEDGEKVNTKRLTDFVQKVMNWKKKDEENN